MPLGTNDKLFLSLANAEEFEKETRLFGRTDRTAVAAYHFRPFGRPQIEAYFGGSLAAELERGGERAFFEFAVGELTSLLGSEFAKRDQADRHALLGDGSARPRRVFACPGRPGRLPERARRAG